MKSGDGSATTINIADTGADTRGKAINASGAVAPTTAAPRTTGKGMMRFRGGWKRGIAVFDFFLRLFGVATSLAAAVAMGTTEQTLPFFTQLFQFQAKFDDFPALTFFVVANAVAGGYLLFSLLISIFNIIRPRVTGSRLFLLMCDTAMLTLTTAGASSAASIIYLAHTGNSNANWLGICRQFGQFCQQSSGAVIASFAAVIVFMLLIVMSALAIRKREK